MAVAGDGSSAYLAASVSTLSANGGPWTIAFWFRPTTLSASQCYIYNERVVGSTAQLGVIWEYTANTVELYAVYYTGTDPRTGSGLTINDTAWHHVAYRKAASGTAEYAKFLDGVKTVIDAGATTVFGSFTVTRVLASINMSGVMVNFTPGEMAQLLVATRALSDGEIAQLAAGADLLTFGKCAGRAWRMIRGSGDQAEAWGGTTLSAVNTVHADNPRIIAPPRRRITYSVPATVGIFRRIGMDGGMMDLAAGLRG